MLMVLTSSITLSNEKKEKFTLSSRAYHLGTGVGTFFISAMQIISATLITYFIYANVAAELETKEANKRLCSVIGAVALFTTPTLCYAAWKTGQYSIAEFKKARTKKPEQNQLSAKS